MLSSLVLGVMPGVLRAWRGSFGSPSQEGGQYCATAADVPALGDTAFGPDIGFTLGITEGSPLSWMATGCGESNVANMRAELVKAKVDVDH